MAAKEWKDQEGPFYDFCSDKDASTSDSDTPVRVQNLSWYDKVSHYRVGATLPAHVDSRLERRLVGESDLVANIGLYGYCGSGKSSFINSLFYCLGEDYIEYAAERRLPSGQTPSVTTEWKAYKLTKSINIIDNRGVDAISINLINEFRKQCNGFRDFGTPVPASWRTSSALRDLFVMMFRGRRFWRSIHCPVWIQRLDDNRDPNVICQVFEAIKKGSGMSPVVVLTVFRDTVDTEQLVRKVAQFQALSCSRIFVTPVYCQQKHDMDLEVSAVLLEILFNCLVVVDQRISEMLLQSER